MSEETFEQFWKWREEMRRKHRTMTIGEYMAWCRGGDAISCPSSTDAFPGGITILLNTPPIIGKVTD
ncbi:hypothetical protein [Taklimakanibacter deserti]|uniref:hypothetical protein n=1 Tax=Taklimakanibacter deserti TaxID=2267839 RepID=UPI0013C51669